MTNILPGLSAHIADVNGQSIGYSMGGDGPPVLLLHGFPQNRAMWGAIARDLAQDHTVVAADLRGYGESSKPGAGPQGMTFRAMAADQVALMQHLGFNRFHMVGHDRGGRTGHRMALDHPDQVSSLTVMDIIPTHTFVNQLTSDAAKAYYHWYFLAQPAPFPETLIGAQPDYFFERCLLGFGKADLSDFDDAAMAWYRKAWRDPEAISAMCDDYRAGISLDVADDSADLKRRVECPSLVLYGAQGAMAAQFDVPATWYSKLANMRAAAMPGGHFFPEQSPGETAQALRAFLGTL